MMEWDWQQAVSLLIVAGAATGLTASKLRRRKFNFERDTHCGCASTPIGPTHGSIVFRARKGGRAEVVMKMK